MLDALSQFAAQVVIAVALLFLLVEVITKPRLIVKLATVVVRFLKREWHKLREAFIELRDEVKHWDTPGSNPPSSTPTKER